MDAPSAYEDFAEMGRGALIDYLELRGHSTSGRKIELVALAYSAFVSNTPIHRRGDKHKSEKGVC